VGGGYGGYFMLVSHKFAMRNATGGMECGAAGCAV